MIFGRYF